MELRRRLNRREFVATTVATGLASIPAVRCRWARKEIAGGFVEDHAELGHRLRSTRAPASPPDGSPERRHRVLVVGAGVAGLTAAWRLVRAGITDIRVLELAPEPGGTAVAGRSSVTAYPWGAHYLPVPDRTQTDLIALLEDLGIVSDRRPDGTPVVGEAHLCAAPQERLFRGGLWHDGLYPSVGAAPADLEEFARFTRRVHQGVAARDARGRRAFTLPVANCSDAPEFMGLDAMTMKAWLDRERFRSPRLLWYVDYACRDDFGLTVEETSAWYGLHYFTARVPAPGQRSAEFMTWPAGNGYLVDRMVERIGRARVVTGQLVTNVRSLPGEAEVTTYAARTGTRSRWTADRVVVALPAFLRARVVEDAVDYRPRMAPWLVANVHLSSPPAGRGASPAWDNVLYDSPSLGYVNARHQALQVAGPTVWTYYRPWTDPDPRVARERLRALRYEDVVRDLLGDLGTAHASLRDHVDRIDVRRWGHAMVAPVPGTLTSAARKQAQVARGRMHFAHSDLSGVALFEEAFFHGFRAAGEVLAGVAGGPPG